MDDVDFESCVVVMAHPDDEVLWSSSILRRSKKVVICYNQAPGSKAVSVGRVGVFDNFPIDNIISLDITESDTYLSTNWKNPIETEYGIRCGRNRDGYARNFHLITSALQDHLDEGDLVVTHNPWGEYGHEEHVQVFRAVSYMKERKGFRVFVTGYVSDRVVGFMEKTIDRLRSKPVLMPVDKPLCEDIKRHYQKHNCWTWEDDYKWPDYECFYEVANSGSPLRRNDKTMASLPVNVVWIDGKISILRRAGRHIKRWFKTSVIDVFFSAPLLMMVPFH